MRRKEEDVKKLGDKYKEKKESQRVKHESTTVKLKRLQELQYKINQLR